MTSTAALRVVRAGPGLTVQDLGRPGRLHEGLPPGGALVPELLRAANQALGNAADAAALELFLHPAVLCARRALVVSVDGRLLRLAAGEELTVGPAPEAVAYVALPGGIDVPRLLGGRGTLVVARLGGFEGRMLRAGDELRAALDPPGRPVDVPRPPLDDGPLRLVPGPDDFPAGSLERLFSETFRIAPALDRTGLRLDGARLATPPDRPFSTPMLRGALQVAHDGTPIVLGPDHPTTGGYPVIATLATDDQGRLARRCPGAPVRFVRG